MFLPWSLLGHTCLPINPGTLRYELAQSQAAAPVIYSQLHRDKALLQPRDTGASQRWDRTQFDPAGPARPGCLRVRPLPLDLKNP